MIRRSVALLGYMFACSFMAHAAPLIYSLPGGLHGIAFKASPEATAAYALTVGATSLDPRPLIAPEIPAGFIERVADTPRGVYARDEWDKGAFLRDNFSARWTGTLRVDKDGEYTFYLTTDDGTRMWVDGNSLIDVWVPRPPTTSEEKIALAAGEHKVVVEFYEGGGGATARLEWSGEGLQRQIISADHVSFEGKPGWRAEYFANTQLTGEPILTATEETIDHEWGEGGPRVGPEEPGEVVLEWTRIADNAIVGRVHSGPESKIVLLAIPVGQAQPDQPKFTVNLSGVAGNEYVFRQEGSNARFMLPATEGSYVFVAGFDPLPELSDIEVRARLKEAYRASLKPNLPPGPADVEGWIRVFNGTDFSGWKPRWGDSVGNWTVKDGVLQTTGGTTDLVSEWTFLDCDLHIEFMYPPQSNSGVYLQGRYEIQIHDSAGRPPESHLCGAVYGIQAPKENVTKPAGEWQAFDISFRSATVDDNGRVKPARITVKHNGVLTIEDAEIPRATGGELDRNYLLPGPIMLQGTHGPVSYRNIEVRIP